MTDQTQSAVEAMAKARWNNHYLAWSWETLPVSVQEDWKNAEQVCLTAYLAHLAAPGWQIVPKVATGRMAVAGLEHGGIGAGLAYDDMLAAAPPFPGRDG